MCDKNKRKNFLGRLIDKLDKKMEQKSKEKPCCDGRDKDRNKPCCS